MSSYDAEIEAMKEISKLFEQLDESAQERVMTWVGSRLGIKNPQFDNSVTNVSAQSAASHERDRANPQPLSTSYDHPAELFEAAHAKSDAERALVLGYWFQVHQSVASFSSRQINDELKHIGHGIGNITRALDALIASKPASVIQLEKSGKSQQAQKKFRLTHEGLKRVQQLLAHSSEE